VRRCGKSALFSLYKQYLKSTGVSDEQIISINLEDIEFEHLLDYKALYYYVKERLCVDKYTYVFIDEVQQCLNFEKAVDSLFIKENVGVYITVSNAYMLSGELATMLSGRYVEIQMLPLSFIEYLDFTESQRKNEPLYMAEEVIPYRNDLIVGEKLSGVRASFNDYLRCGSFPYVAMREGINDVSLLEGIIKFLSGSIGSPISTKKISDTINYSGRKISVNTVERYLRALTDSFIFYKVDRFDIKGKQNLKTLGKYYIVDTGIRALTTSTSSSDLGSILENVVFLELLRRGYKVNIGKIAAKEVDFVATDGSGITYYQVSATVLDENTLNRELAPLQKISDNHPKILLTLDDIMANANYDRIKQINIIDWLLRNA